jgi:hypothetical protein
MQPPATFPPGGVTEADIYMAAMIGRRDKETAQIEQQFNQTEKGPLYRVRGVWGSYPVFTG